MKYLIIIAPLFFSIVQGQSSNQNRKFEFGVSFSNDIGYRLLKHNDSDASNDFILDQRNDREIPKYCYSAGVTVAYKFNADARISSGILYSNKGYQTEKLTFQPSSDPAIPKDVRIRYNMNYIDIPLLFNYRFGQNKWRFSIGAGIKTSVFLNEIQTSMLYYDDKVDRESNETTFDYNRFNISPQLELGVIYDLHERFYISASPTFNYGILKIIDAPITAYLFTGGINLGIHFK